MTVMTEMPITEDDVSLVKERNSVEISGEKFKELLEYLTHIEDELSVSEFDLATEQRFTGLLINAFADSIDSVRSASPDTDLRELSSKLFQEWESCLSRQVEQGVISAVQLRRFHRAFEVAIASSNESCESGYAES
jgi:hypothetical protein